MNRKNTKLVTVKVSGVHSGADPSPGLGIAKSLKAAIPNIYLIGKDHSVTSSGLHHSVFDKIEIFPSWDEINLQCYTNELADFLLEEQSFYISGLDAEIDWLASGNLSNNKRILNPSKSVLQQIQKPIIKAHAALGMKIPDYISAKAPPFELHRFGRIGGWKLWVKGKFHEAYSTKSFKEMMSNIGKMESSWPIDDIFIQQNITGNERAITFCAINGKLINAVEIEKRSLTTQGKTWAASVSIASADILKKVSDFVESNNWTGGGEIEFLRDSRNTDWLIDINPRFPAYIYGVTLCGHNMPAQLVAAATNTDIIKTRTYHSQFIRIVEEIPINPQIPLPTILSQKSESIGNQKHPSFQPALVKKTHISDLPFNKLREITTEDLRTLPENQRVRDFSSLQELIHLINDISYTHSIKISPTLSVKTDPQPKIACEFIKNKWGAEVISEDEYKWAIANGFSPASITINGPLAAYIFTAVNQECNYCFSDSIEAFTHLTSRVASSKIGIRIKPTNFPSRFGLDLSDYSVYSRTIDELQKIPFFMGWGAHMHLPADVIGPDLWFKCIQELISWAKALEESSERRVTALDIGGGWHHNEFSSLFLPMLKNRVIPLIKEELPNVSEVIFEAGKALAAQTATFIATIIEVRTTENEKDYVVVASCSIADLPMSQFYAYPIIHARNGVPISTLQHGGSSILGSICMENDILAQGVGFSERPIVGDSLIFTAAGGYNASMAWNFAKGINRDA